MPRSWTQMGKVVCIINEYIYLFVLFTDKNKVCACMFSRFLACEHGGIYTVPANNGFKATKLLLP